MLFEALYMEKSIERKLQKDRDYGIIASLFRFKTFATSIAQELLKKCGRGCNTMVVGGFFS